MTSRFDAIAGDWDDDPVKQQRSADTAATIRRVLGLTEPVRLLEYGAGTGLVAQSLAEHTAHLTLVEPSAGMRAVIDEKITAGMFPADTTLLDIDLTRQPAGDTQVDVVVTSLVLHHVHDLDAAVNGFAHWLRGGGVVAIVDLEEEDGSFHDPDAEHAHDGIARHTLTALLEAAGFGDVAFTPAGEVDRHGRPYPLFLATARI